jgi:hypothetical protein
MDLREIGWDDVKGAGVYHYREKWWAVGLHINADNYFDFLRN